MNSLILHSDGLTQVHLHLEAMLNKLRMLLAIPAGDENDGHPYRNTFAALAHGFKDFATEVSEITFDGYGSFDNWSFDNFVIAED